MSLTKVSYSMIAGAPVNVLDYGADPSGTLSSSVAIQAALTAGAGGSVYFPIGNYKLSAYVVIPNNTYVYGDGVGSRLFADGTVAELVRTAFPTSNVTLDGICIDGGKSAGTGAVVVCFYSPASTVTPTTYNKDITVKNCIIKNASSGPAIENGTNINIYNNIISAMFYQTVGEPSAGSYGYGVVLNGCTKSSVKDNTIGISGALIQRHGIYLPVFKNADVAPTVLNFCSDIQISGNTVFVNSVIDPFSSCIESWNYFDFLITNNILIGGVRGINAAPEYVSGSRVLIDGNVIRDSSICVRNGPATYTTGTYFEEYTITNNQFLPVTTAAHQCVKVQSIKNIIFANNYCRGSASSTFAFGYYDVIENIVANSIQSANNRITGFTQGFYLSNVTLFNDTKTVFSNFTGATFPYVKVSAVSLTEMTPSSTPYEEYYTNSGNDWSLVRYFSLNLIKPITYNGSFWQDDLGTRVYGTTAQRPNGALLQSGYRYYDTTVGSMIFWNGSIWTT
jgi:hypothetical protein